MNDDEVREQLVQLVKTKGIKYTFIANKVGVHRSTLCHFVKNDRRVAKTLITNLENYLKNN